MDFQIFNAGYLIQPWYSPMDFYCAAKILVGLTKLGAKVVTSLVRRATAKLEARAALKGATESLAGNPETKRPRIPPSRGLERPTLLRSRGAEVLESAHECADGSTLERCIEYETLPRPAAPGSKT